MLKLRGNEEYLSVNQLVNIFDIVSCKEEQASQIIAWLLDPLQGHQLKEKALKVLLETIADKGKIVCFQKTTPCEVTCKEILRKNILKNIVVQTEFCINDCQKETNKNRIDILVSIDKDKEDVDKGYILVIENKYGSTENGEQTKKYFNYMSQQYPNHKIIYIYMDCFQDFFYFFPQEFSDISDTENYSHACNYEWLIYDLLKENMSRNKLLKDIYLEFSGNYEEEKRLSSFYKNINSNKISYNENLKEYKKAGAYIPGSLKNIQLYQYRYFWQALAEYPLGQMYIYKLQQISQYKDYIFGYKNNSFFITTEYAAELQKKHHKNKWPYNIYVHRIKNKQLVELWFNGEYLNSPKQKTDFTKMLNKIFPDIKIKDKGWFKIVQYSRQQEGEIEIDREFKNILNKCIANLNEFEKSYKSLF